MVKGIDTWSFDWNALNSISFKCQIREGLDNGQRRIIRLLMFKVSITEGQLVLKTEIDPFCILFSHSLKQLKCLHMLEPRLYKWPKYRYN